MPCQALKTAAPQPRWHQAGRVTEGQKCREMGGGLNAKQHSKIDVSS